MYKLLGGLKDYFKLQEIQTDNAVFRLHNVFTTVLLLTCSLVITATQYVGNPISCIVSGVPTHVVNTFCWISSTFTMPDAFKRQVRLITRQRSLDVCPRNMKRRSRPTRLIELSFVPWMISGFGGKRSRDCIEWNVHL